MQLFVFNFIKMQKLHYAIFALLMQYTMQQHIFTIPLHIYKKNAKKMQLCGIYDAIEFPRAITSLCKQL